MSEIIAFAGISALQPALKTLPLTKAFVLVERTPASWVDEPGRQGLLRFDVGDADVPYDEYDVGRVFCRDYEVRWDRRLDTVVYVGEERVLPNFTIEAITLDKAHDLSYSLWGALVADPRTLGLPGDSVVYAELRLPRLLQYPVSRHEHRSSARHVRVHAREYVDPATGRVVASRFCNIEEST